MTGAAARDCLALAMDLTLANAEALYDQVSEYVGTVKVGSPLFVEKGPAAVQAFLRRGARVFLDLKLHDIPNTVGLAAQRAAELGVSLLTVHAQGGPSMMRAALEGAKRGASNARVSPPRLLAVTVLTSLDTSELSAIGWTQPPDALVATLAGVAQASGVDGLVCSPREVAQLRKTFGSQFFLCTPGIRPTASNKQDQTRSETAAEAIRAGADLLVVGRPIYEAPDPVAAARSLCAEIATAQSVRAAH
jgi:orotidine-5'-phosphate decarboxylase